MLLNMQDVSPRDLPDGDNVVDTNHMTDCVTVVVFWGLSGADYQHVRAWHLPGGLNSERMDILFDGVPESADLRAFICQGTVSRTSDGDIERFRRWRNETRPDISRAQVLRSASRYRINRRCEVGS